MMPKKTDQCERVCLFNNTTGAYSNKLCSYQNYKIAPIYRVIFKRLIDGFKTGSIGPQLRVLCGIKRRLAEFTYRLGFLIVFWAAKRSHWLMANTMTKSMRPASPLNNVKRAEALVTSLFVNQRRASSLNTIFGKKMFPRQDVLRRPYTKNSSYRQVSWFQFLNQLCVIRLNAKILA